MNSTERLACFSFRSERTRVETKDFPDRILTDLSLHFLHHRVVAVVVVAVDAASVAVVAASVVVVAVAAVEAAGDRIIHDVVTT